MEYKTTTRIIENGLDSSPEWDYIADYLRPAFGDEGASKNDLRLVCREGLALVLIKGSRHPEVFRASKDLAVLAERMAVALMGSEWVENTASQLPAGFMRSKHDGRTVLTDSDKKALHVD